MPAAPPPAAPAAYTPAAPAPSAAALADAARLAALHATGLLDAALGPPAGPADAGLDRLTRLVARVLRVPVALASLVGTERQFVAGCAGLGDPIASTREIPNTHSLCPRVVATAAPLVLEDARTDPRTRDNPGVREFGIAAYAGVPLATREGHVIGSLCVIDAVPRQWTVDELDTLADFAAEAVTTLELRTAERAAAAREAELRAVLDTTDELTCLTDAAGRLTFVNGAWQRAMGYTEEEALAIDPVSMVAPEDRGRYRAAARRLVAGQAVRDFEATLMGRDGRRVACRGWAVPRFAPGPDGRPVAAGAQAGYRDATAERRAEAARAHLAATLEASPDLVALATSEGELTYLNRAGRHLTGLGEDDSLAGRRLAELLPDDAAAAVRAAMPAAARDGAWVGETTLRGAEGEPIPVSLGLVTHATAVGAGPQAAGVVSLVARDLRERVRADAARQASEARFRAALDGSLDAFFILEAVRGADGRIADFAFAELNARGAALLGMPAEDYTGHRLGELYPLAHATPLFDTLARVAASGRPWEGEFKPEDPRVAAGWLHMQVVPFGAAGGAVGVAVTIRDVTERKRADGEARLLHDVTRVLGAAEGVEDALRAALHAMCQATNLPYGEVWTPASPPDVAGPAQPGALVRGPAWHVAGDARLAAFAVDSASHTFAHGVELPGRAAAEGKPVWLPDVTADGAHFLRAPLARRAGLRGGLAVPVLADGELVAVLAFHSRLVEAFGEGELALLASVGAQVGAVVRQKLAEAALRRSEARFRGVLENLSAFAVEVDTAGQVTFANDALLAATGWARDEVAGRDYFDRFIAEGAAIRAVFRETIAAGRADELPAHYENEILTRDGRARVVAWDNAVLFDAAGRVTGVASVGRDVTDEARVRRLKDQLIATASHELRTPLTAIKSALDMLGDTGGAAASPRPADARSEREQYLLGMARRNTQRLVRLVGDLLDVERLDEGQAPLRCEALDASGVLSFAWDALRPLADQAGVRLVTAPTADAAAPVWADAERVQQVVANLVGNAVKFSPRGGAVTLSAAAEPTAGAPLDVPNGGAAARFTRFTVRDDGRGIPADQLEAVFDRFVQVHADDARVRGGAGLGLAICRAVVAQHGGRIWAESAGEGRGSAFHFTLPVAPTR